MYTITPNLPRHPLINYEFPVGSNSSYNNKYDPDDDERERGNVDRQSRSRYRA